MKHAGGRTRRRCCWAWWWAPRAAPSAWRWVWPACSPGRCWARLYGALFGLLGAERATSPGSGLLWSLAYAFLLWLAIPAGILPLVAGGMPAMGMLDTARAHFPELVAYLICFGVPLGLLPGRMGHQSQAGRGGFARV